MALYDGQIDDFNVIFRKLAKYWKVFPISILFFVSLGVIYNKLAEPIYEIGAKVVVHERQRNIADPTSFLPGSELFSGRNTFHNSLLTLQARPLLEKVLNKLNFSVMYYEEKLLYNENLYTSSPFEVIIDKNHLQMTNVVFNVEVLSASEFVLSAKNEECMLYDFQKERNDREVANFEMSQKFNFGKTIESEYFKFTVLLKEGVALEEVSANDYFFDVKGKTQLVGELKEQLTIEPANVDGTVVNVLLKSNNARMGIDFLEQYVVTIIEDNLDRKNYIAHTTIDFIDNQLSQVFDSLNLAEKSLQEFRTQKQVIDVGMKASQIYDNLNALMAEKEEKESHLQYLEFLNSNFNKDDDFTDYSLTILSDLNNQVLNDLLNEYVDLVGRKRHLIENRQDKSPQLRELNFQTNNLKKTILVNLQYAVEAARIELQRTNGKVASLNSELNRLPETQRNLVTYERNFNLNDATYTYLMEKRSEAQIAKASNLPDYEVFDFPAIEDQASPNTTRNLVLAVFLALILPTFLILIYEAYFEKTSDVDDFKSTFNMFSLGQIYHHSGDAMKIFGEDQGITAESFRKLRTNLGFHGWSDKKRGKIIMLTSTLPGEGKTFCSYNLAFSIAKSGKKTILLDFDLRKGDLTEKYYTRNGHAGISELLSGQAEYGDIKKDTAKNGLTILPSGPLPPNPSELIDSEENRVFLKRLKEEYDYIIVDTAPVTVTSESIFLAGLADLVMIVLRVNYTLKKDFRRTLDEMEGKFGQKVSVILNGMKMSRSSYYQYASYYSRSKDKK
ncbi:polysaccharide biosynthesis tyrosine autokinase [Marinilabiliaceae bacterium JC017]|nr:polysaccharide biosynthesis tyrosine autokinase [Marinilabiliaceae bacterium JC017]